MSSGASVSTIPPAIPALGLGLVCRLTILIPATTTFLSPTNRETVPRLPLSLPVMTITSSLALILRIFTRPRCLSQHFGCQGDDTHELFCTQFTCHRPEHTRPNGSLLGVKKNRS